MKINQIKIIMLLFALSLGACSLFNKSHQRRQKVTTLDSISMSKILEAINKNKEQGGDNDNDNRPYEASATKTWDLENMDLDVEFDYAKAQLMGFERLTLTPHAYTQDSLVLDARGMEIKEIFDGDTRGLTNLRFNYDQKKLTIYLRMPASAGYPKKINIRYIAKPNEVVVKGSEAISSDKGLYFINNDGRDPIKPRQVWTQGETESNSCWFPTIDKPNQKMTQEINITIQDSNDVTLSNGKFMGRVKKDNGTFTDTWIQTIPAAPYLTMLTVGRFYVEHDKWRDKEVNYYVEPNYKPYAKLIFGKTPEMIEFYSKLLGVDYVWDKYSQIVVRDYVSGSMENASATLHGEFLQMDSREYIDDNKEEYISHELFHQWFGDLVTCESWSNLPLNESFATYGEYLWLEHSAGKMEADMHLEGDLHKYMRDASYHQESLIRFHYDDKEDMFDTHSYEKGGCILHLLRTYLGDEVFFKGLKLYLEKNKFKSVEVHDLRLALEEVSGEDLNWFFNEWFLRAGHPKVAIKQSYDNETKSQNLSVDFIKANESTPRKFTLPVKVDFYFKDSVHRESIIIKDWTNKWVFNFNEQPLLVNVDAERAMIWEIDYPKTKDELKYQVLHASLYRDKKEAMDILSHDETLGNNEKYLVIDYCLAHSFWGVKKMGIAMMDAMEAKDIDPYFNKITQMIMTEKKSSLRVDLLDLLEKMKDTHEMIPLLRACTNDSSYMVMAKALDMLSEKTMPITLKICEANEYIENWQVMNRITAIYSKDTTGNHAGYFFRSMQLAGKYEKKTRLKEIEYYIRRTSVDNAYLTISELALLKDKLKDEFTGAFLPDIKDYFQEKHDALVIFMQNAPRTSEDGYKDAIHRLEVYNKILELMKN